MCALFCQRVALRGHIMPRNRRAGGIRPPRASWEARPVAAWRKPALVPLGACSHRPSLNRTSRHHSCIGHAGAAHQDNIPAREWRRAIHRGPIPAPEAPKSYIGALFLHFRNLVLEYGPYVRDAAGITRTCAHYSSTGPVNPYIDPLSQHEIFELQEYSPYVRPCALRVQE